MGSVLRYEWRRIVSVRSTWVLGAGFVLSALAFALLAAFVLPSVTVNDGSGAPGPSLRSPLSSVVTTGTNFVSLVFLLTIAAQVFGHEYRYGTMRLTLTAFPVRWRVFTAKALMLVLWLTLFYAASVVVCWVVALLAGDGVDPQPVGEVLAAVVRSWAFVVGVCLLGFAVTAITRNLALGVVVVLLWAAVLEGLLAGLLSGRLPWLNDVLPITNGSLAAAGESLPRSALVFGAWVVALVAAAAVVFDKRDA